MPSDLPRDLPTKEELDESLAMAYTAKASGFKTVVCDVDVLIEALAAARTLHSLRETSGLTQAQRDHAGLTAAALRRDGYVAAVVIESLVRCIDSLSLRLAERERRIGELEGMRDAWRKAARLIYETLQSAGGPASAIVVGKRDWQAIVAAIQEATDLDDAEARRLAQGREGK